MKSKSPSLQLVVTEEINQASLERKGTCISITFAIHVAVEGIYLFDVCDIKSRLNSQIPVINLLDATFFPSIILGSDCCIQHLHPSLALGVVGDEV